MTATRKRGRDANRQDRIGEAEPGSARCLIETARERLVQAAEGLEPGRERHLPLVRFKVKAAALLLKLAEMA